MIWKILSKPRVSRDELIKSPPKECSPFKVLLFIFLNQCVRTYRVFYYWQDLREFEKNVIILYRPIKEKKVLASHNPIYLATSLINLFTV